MKHMGNAKKQKVTFIGFGEAAMTFVKGWGNACPANIKAYDIKINDPEETTRQKKYCEYKNSGVIGCPDLAQALHDTAIIFSLVTADQALSAAKDAADHMAADHMANDALYLDCNSCAPDTKRKAAEIISAAGGLYVDVAVMAPVKVDLSKVPLLLSGRHAETARAVLEKLNMTASVMSLDVGDASSVKMMRSIMIKGTEALMMECILSARKAGVEDIVLKSLADSFSKEKATYMLERMTKHGLRRAAEMKEVSLTIEQLGLTGRMAKATAQWQQQIGELEINEPDTENYQTLADNILGRLKEKEEINEQPIKRSIG